jgi:hypothetical protein
MQKIVTITNEHLHVLYFEFDSNPGFSSFQNSFISQDKQQSKI